jgi:hypothetical protein
MIITEHTIHILQLGNHTILGSCTEVNKFFYI